MAVTPATATTFTGLTASTTIATADIMAADIGGVTKKITMGNLRTSLFAFAAADPINTGSITAVGNSTITGTLSGITTLATTGAVTFGAGLTVAAGLTVTAGPFAVTGASAGATVATFAAADNLNDTTVLVFKRNDGVIAGSIKYSFANSDFQIGTTTAAQFRLMSNNTTAITLSNANAIFDGNISLSTAVSKIIPGATSLSLRNNANNADNLIITDNGLATFRLSVTASSGFISGGTATNGGLNIQRTGTPSAPPDGDMWITTANAFARINGVTKTVQSSASGNLIGAQATGYTNAWTGAAANRATSYDAASITLPQLAARVRALQDDLQLTHTLLAV